MENFQFFNESFHPFAQTYNPLKCASIDGTDTEPHDAAVVRAQESHFCPSKQLSNCEENTIIVARLSRDTDESTLEKHFCRFGKVKSIRLVRNLVTGTSQCYAFIEYLIKEDAVRAYERGHKNIIDGREILVDYEIQRSLTGWIPRRFGGGFGGKKESGQLRFGCRDRPFQKPLHLKDEAKHHVRTEFQGFGDHRRGSRRPESRRNSRSPRREHSSRHQRRSRSRERSRRRYNRS